MNKTHLTAIARKTLPCPTRWLWGQGKLLGNVLDYGCGRCHEMNNRYLVIDGYDPYFRPDGIVKSQYNTIICNYVLNVIPDKKERGEVLYNIEALLAPDGNAYISVRNDIAEPYKSRRGTEQLVINLALPLIHQTTGYRIYQLKPYETN